MTMNYATIVRDNFDYFDSHLNNRIFLLTTPKGESIVVKCERQNFAHLIGVHYATENSLFRFKGNEFYYKMKNKNDINGLFDLVNEEDYYNNDLPVEATFIEGKNRYFIDLFESLLKSNGSSIRVFRQQPGGQFDADFLHLMIVNPDTNQKGYIGIVGSDKNNYFWFNSIYIDDNTSRVLGAPFTIKSIRIISEVEYQNLRTVSLYPSPRNKNNKKPRENNKARAFKLDKTTVNKINRQLSDGYQIIKGNGKASHYQLTRNKVIIIDNFQNEPYITSIPEIVNHIKALNKNT